MAKHYDCKNYFMCDNINNRNVETLAFAKQKWLLKKSKTKFKSNLKKVLLLKN